MSLVWKAPNNVEQLLYTIKEKHHHPRLGLATFGIAFAETKPFINDRFNWGKVTKFTKFNKLWQTEKVDFSITLCSEVWHSILTVHQKEALLDLHLSRCAVKYIPETVMEGKKKVLVKAPWGRIQYTDEMKLDDDGNPQWYVLPADLPVFSENANRYGLWYTDFTETPLSVSKELSEDETE